MFVWSDVFRVSEIVQARIFKKQNHILISRNEHVGKIVCCAFEYISGRDLLRLNRLWPVHVAVVGSSHSVQLKSVQSTLIQRTSAMRRCTRNDFFSKALLASVARGTREARLVNEGGNLRAHKANQIRKASKLREAAHRTRWVSPFSSLQVDPVPQTVPDNVDSSSRRRRRVPHGSHRGHPAVEGGATLVDSSDDNASFTVPGSAASLVWPSRRLVLVPRSVDVTPQSTRTASGTEEAWRHRGTPDRGRLMSDYSDREC